MDPNTQTGINLLVEVRQPVLDKNGRIHPLKSLISLIELTNIHFNDSVADVVNIMTSVFTRTPAEPEDLNQVIQLVSEHMIQSVNNNNDVKEILSKLFESINTDIYNTYTSFKTDVLNNRPIEEKLLFIAKYLARDDDVRLFRTGYTTTHVLLTATYLYAIDNSNIEQPAKGNILAHYLVALLYDVLTDQIVQYEFFENDYLTSNGVEIRVGVYSKALKSAVAIHGTAPSIDGGSALQEIYNKYVPALWPLPVFVGKSHKSRLELMYNQIVNKLSTELRDRNVTLCPFNILMDKVWPKILSDHTFKMETLVDCIPIILIYTAG